MNTFTRKISAVLALSTLLLAGCGGSSSSDGGVSPPPPPPPPPPSGGITRTGVGVAVGPITGFGSVIVNGVTYDTSSATFTRDDQAATQADFAVGEAVIVQGTIDDNNSNAVAQSVELNDIVEGPVTALNSAGQLSVMGQTVQTGANTSIDDSCGAALDNLAPLLTVFAVEVSGTADANGVIDATRIECKLITEVDDFEVNGIVSGHDSGASTFMINDLLVNYGSAASIDDFPGGIITDGDPVEAKGSPANFDDSGFPPVLTASRVEFKGARFADNEGDHIEIDGFITRYVSPTDFDVSGIPVTEIPGTVYENGTSADLGMNLKVEVEGEFDANGVLNATKIEIKTSTNVRVVGQVDTVSGSVITILGISVNTDPTTTRFEDKRDDVDPFRVGDINTDDYVEARGQELPPGQITAFLIERDDFDPLSDDTELRGFVEDGSVNGRTSFVILGVTVDTSTVSPGNYFSDDESGNEVPITADAFWAAVGTGGVLVDVNGTETGPTALQARELGLEME